MAGLRIEISGIVCDNPNCNYGDEDVTFEQYPEYLNKPCPKCGDNLLTQEDYDDCLKQVENIEKLNKLAELGAAMFGIDLANIPGDPDDVITIENKFEERKISKV